MHESLILLSVFSASGEESHSTWIDQIHEVMHVIAVLVEVIGVAVIVWGVLCGFLRLVRLEKDDFKGLAVVSQRDALKEHLGFYLLLALEFLVAADIIETLIDPTMEHLLILGVIVGIRTVISLSLNWELSQKEKQ